MKNYKFGHELTATLKQQSTYGKLCTEYYELEQHPHDAQAVSFYIQKACEIGGPILEPMCGTGRFLIPLLQQGLEAEGFDASPHMLQVCREKYERIQGAVVPVWQEFIEDFHSDKRYRFIFVPYGSWGLIVDPQESRKCLEIMYKHLVPGGTFIVEIETVFSIQQPLGVWHRRVQVRPNGGGRLVLDILPSYDSLRQLYVCLCRYTSIVEQTTEVETENFQQYLYRNHEMDHLLADVGFQHIAKYIDYSGTPVSHPTAPLIIYECVK